MKALTLHQPWASLVALGVKTIETRSWETKYRGPLAIHAAATTAGFELLPGDCEGTTEGGWRYGYIGDFQAAYCYRTSDEGTRGDTYLHRLDGLGATNEPGPCPLGAVVATCTLVDVVPMVDVIGADGHPGPFLEVSDRYLSFWRGVGTDHVAERLDDQRPYGVFSPGRFAWLLDDVKPTTERCPACWGSGRIGRTIPGVPPDVCTASAPCSACWPRKDDGSLKFWDDGSAGRCDPVPARGRQGLWEWTP